MVQGTDKSTREHGLALHKAGYIANNYVVGHHLKLLFQVKTDLDSHFSNRKKLTGH